MCTEHSPYTERGHKSSSIFFFVAVKVVHEWSENERCDNLITLTRVPPSWRFLFAHIQDQLMFSYVAKFCNFSFNPSFGLHLIFLVFDARDCKKGVSNWRQPTYANFLTSSRHLLVCHMDCVPPPLVSIKPLWQTHGYLC